MTDYISREAAIAVIEEKQKELCPLGMFSRHAVYGTDIEQFDAWEEIIEQIERIPAADVRENKRGEWIVCGDGDYVPYMCSHCGKTSPANLIKNWGHNFCPNCGAKMENEDSMEWKMKNCCCCDTEATDAWTPYTMGRPRRRRPKGGADPAGQLQPGHAGGAAEAGAIRRHGGRGQLLGADAAEAGGPAALGPGRYQLGGRACTSKNVRGH